MKENETREFNPILKRAILESVEQQINDNNPKETLETLQRLMKSGYTRDEAIEKIAVVVMQEIYDVEKNRENFNKERFTNRLHRLK